MPCSYLLGIRLNLMRKNSILNVDLSLCSLDFWKILINIQYKNYLGLLLLGFFLVACVPSTDDEGPTVTVQEVNATSSFYPQQTGLTWEYLPDGGNLESERAIQRVQGPQVIGGEKYIVTSIVGRGLDISYYRKYLAGGVFLSQQRGPGYITKFSPPIKELPSQSNFRLGASWQGKSQAEIHFTDAPRGKNRVRFTTEYIYTIVDKRPIRLNLGENIREFEIYVINLEGRKLGEDDEVLETLHSEIWFSPYVGEVRNKDDFVLVGGNFSQKPN